MAVGVAAELNTVLLRDSVLLDDPIAPVVVIVVGCLDIHKADQRGQDQPTQQADSCR